MAAVGSIERTGTIDFVRDGKTYKTWFKVFGDPTSAYQTSKIPLVILHGGPAIPNPYMSPHEKLFSKTYLDGAPLIFYDQIGGGKSSHPHIEGEGVGDPETFYTVDLFMDELYNVLNYFGLLQRGRQFDLLGHSWGGMLGADYVATRTPVNLRKLVIADAPASMLLWEKAVNQLLDIDDDDHKTIKRELSKYKPGDPEYEEWTMEFYKLHICRIEWPKHLNDAFESMGSDPVVYTTMIGPSEFDITGSLRTWSVVEKLENINVPTLLINGKYDEAQNVCVDPFESGIPHGLVTRKEFTESSHMPFWEEPEAYLEAVSTFLTK